MKSRAKLILAVSASLAFLFSVNANAGSSIQYTDSDKRMLVEVCKAIKSNSKVKLNKVLHKNRITFDEMAKGLVCNGQDALSFAKYHDADENFDLITKRTKAREEEIVASLN
ncbi:DUF3718 domain-containing protein [Glaciecola sp. 1036]|uniref:DUF3718 domain-containing protein n=1 Tax=Alteromonadaceae TaxID=72275 RepID=UPI003D04A661